MSRLIQKHNRLHEKHRRQQEVLHNREGCGPFEVWPRRSFERPRDRKAGSEGARTLDTSPCGHGKQNRLSRPLGQAVPHEVVYRAIQTEIGRYWDRFCRTSGSRRIDRAILSGRGSDHGIRRDIRGASLAQYLALPETKAVKGTVTIPDGLDYDVAAACPEGTFYAASGLNQLNPKAGQKAMVYGVTGAIGSAYVQLLK